MGALSRTLFFLALLMGQVGCARSSYKRFIPAEEAARAALTASLEAWERGEPHGPVAGTEAPVVHFVDSHHKPEQRLKGYEVQTMVPGEGPRVFAVRLKLDNPAEEMRVRYVVVGLDPLWVLRQEDYDMTAHWEHPMKKP